MPIFKISGIITISCYTDVEADTEEEALQIAEDREMMELPFNNAYGSDEYWITDSLDGRPREIHISE